jgi:hypothetical protein
VGFVLLRIESKKSNPELERVDAHTYNNLALLLFSRLVKYIALISILLVEEDAQMDILSLNQLALHASVARQKGNVQTTNN